MADDFDVILIGAGHPGKVAADAAPTAAWPLPRWSGS
jgi:tRNA U34 5-carboxymethylaminomethyl modifying enzyme MnmG/GidA